MHRDAAEARALRDAFGAYPTGVTVATTIDGAGAPRGFTANSFSSVSLAPPLISICIDHRSASLEAFRAGPGFAVNVLAASQRPIAERFASPVRERFAGLDWRGGRAGSPLLGGVAAWFDCALEQAICAGDHDILLGRVVAYGASGEAGLGYVGGRFFVPPIGLDAQGQ